MHKIRYFKGRIPSKAKFHGKVSRARASSKPTPFRPTPSVSSRASVSTRFYSYLGVKSLGIKTFFVLSHVVLLRLLGLFDCHCRSLCTARLNVVTNSFTVPLRTPR